ncbi:hypothetical protein ACFV2X_08450 [Streptomyces sp. NPDC059679]|uniref:hypothetical protein n=1 Tax=Streptomyces sp. NPDC059679 TaxID=3346903 RepID=UPI00368F7637
MLLDGLDQALKEAGRPASHRRRWRCRFGWRQITAQVLYVAAVTFFVVSLLLYGQGGR